MIKWARTGALILALGLVAPSAFGQSQSQAQIAAALGVGDAKLAEQLADAALNDATKPPAEHSLLLTDRGMAQEAQGRHEEALVDLTQAIEMHALPPADQAHALFTRGAILDALDRLSDAIGDYSAALMLEPRYSPALNNRANAWRRQGHMDEAKRDYLASLAAGNLQPEYSYYGLGQIAEAAGNNDGARAFYAQAVAANPNYGLAAARLAALGGVPGKSVADAGIIHLRPPKATPAATAPVPAQTDGIIHLRPPRTAVAAASDDDNKAGPGLRPALDAAGRGAQVQLGAWRSEEEARQGWNRALQRSGGLLTGLSPQIGAVSLPGKGLYYRLRIGPVSGGAAKFCSALTAQGLDCIPARD